MLNPHNRKFSVKYRIEKWFYEDSLNCLRKVLSVIGMMIICAGMFGVLFFLPAFFH